MAIQKGPSLRQPPWHPGDRRMVMPPGTNNAMVHPQCGKSPEGPNLFLDWRGSGAYLPMSCPPAPCPRVHFSKTCWPWHCFARPCSWRKWPPIKSPASTIRCPTAHGHHRRRPCHCPRDRYWRKPNTSCPPKAGRSSCNGSCRRNNLHPRHRKPAR